MTTVIIFLGAYLALTVALTVAVRPYRVRLLALVAELCAPNVPEDVRDLAQRVGIYAYSLRVAPVHVFWYLRMLVMPMRQVHAEALEYGEEHPGIIAEPRIDELYELYLVSICAANPAFGAIALVLRVIFKAKVRLYAHRLHWSEEPVVAYGELKAMA